MNTHLRGHLRSGEPIEMEADLGDLDVGDSFLVRSGAETGTERVIITGLRRALSPAGVEHQVAVVEPYDTPRDATAA